MDSFSMWCFVSHFFHWVHVSWLHPCCSVDVYSIPFNDCIIFHCLDRPEFVYSSIHQLVHIRVVSTFWLLWIMLLWTFMYKSLFESLLSILLGKYLGVQLLGHTVTLCLTFWGTTKLFFTVAASFYLPVSNVQHLLFSCFWLCPA